MKILLTGGCGFIGTNLVRHLLAATDHHIVNLDKLTYAGNPHSLDDVVDSDRYEFVQADLADPALVGEVVKQADPDAVMHLAAESHVDRSIDGPSEFIQTNVVGTFNLLDSSLRHYNELAGDRREAFRFLHVSTDEVYGSLGETGMFTETTRYDPHSPYSATKAASDHLARAWKTTFGLPVIVTNCSNNYGPYQFPEKLLPLMIIKCLAEEPLPVYGKGLNVRDWLYVEDHAKALTTALLKGTPGETYNIGGNSERRNIDLVHAVIAILDEIRPRSNGKSYSELITYVTDRPGHDFRYAIDSSKIQKELGWQPERSLEECLRATVQWYLDNQSWWQDIMNGKYQLQRLGRS
ncbi:dTDP-glucose 4,6-dehydratase 2 [Planctomycetes bacterium CA13]|uniref:dTDP-glucose 4,6-dehydratase n=1 Tax=Novipirellula herctigrandis TaxID=2527986 RepID=A0A5C5Z9L9_9BACT|nr:dTDP-glucose 4,6-dehydratase 2 [Planctomycetes bacterium CA13]